MHKNYFFTFASLIIFTTTLKAAHFSTLTYEDIRQEGGFNSSPISRGSSIVPAGPCLTEQEKLDLCKSKVLKNLASLDLTDQKIDDSFIEKLSKNKNFSRISRLDLSNNPDITDRSLELILKSKFLGSLRHLPQISGRYDIPATELRIIASGTNISDQSSNKSGFYTKTTFGFTIRYENPRTGQIKGEDTGVRITEVIL